VDEAHIVEPEPGNGWTRGEEEQQSPSREARSQPKEVRRARGATRDRQLSYEQEQQRREAKRIDKRCPRAQAALRCRSSHQAVARIAQPREHTGQDTQRVHAPHGWIQSPCDQDAPSQAQGDRPYLAPVQIFLEQPPTQQRRECSRAVGHHRSDGRAVVGHRKRPHRIEGREHDAVDRQEGDVATSRPQQNRPEDQQDRQERHNDEDVAPDGQHECRNGIGDGQVADEDRRRR